MSTLTRYRFSSKKFSEYLKHHGIPWPTTPSGRLRLDDDTFRSMAKSFPQLSALRELRHSQGQMRLFDLPVGADGRSRCLLSAFRSKTGRNQPSNAKYPFGSSVWMRGLMKPAPGMALAYIDYSQQEFGIGAALSGDQKMKAAYLSGDPYLSFAKQAGAAPSDATKATHGAVREQYKKCALAVQYGMGEDSLAVEINGSRFEARHLLKKHRETYRRFWEWSDATLTHVALRGHLYTVFGWTIHADQKMNERSMRNFPMQANGAEMLRLACCLAVEAGIRVVAPVHDAVLIESRLEKIDEDVARTQRLMEDASSVVLDGFRLRTDVQIVRYPDRFMDDKRGRQMWDTVCQIVDELELEELKLRDPARTIEAIIDAL
jgi:hypothetical protein